MLPKLLKSYKNKNKQKKTKTVRHYHCPTCSKPLQNLKFLSHLKNSFYNDREEKINENEELFSSTPHESSAVMDKYLEPRKPKHANRNIWKKERTLLNLMVIITILKS